VNILITLTRPMLRSQMTHAGQQWDVPRLLPVSMLLQERTCSENTPGPDVTVELKEASQPEL
jgi:hypothetical protein